MNKFLLSLAAVASFSLSGNSKEWLEFKESVIEVQRSIAGWCSEENAHKMMDLVQQVQPEICVEIGVFCGSSAYPLAQSIKYYNCGIMYAIDSWTCKACLEGFEDNPPLAIWWSLIDHDQIYSEFCKLIKKYNLHQHCIILRAKSDNAVTLFQDKSIDILHIDGNHSIQQSMRDIRNYLPKVKHGGYILISGSDWPTMGQAVDYMHKNCEFIEEKSIVNKYLVFQKPNQY